MRNNQRKKQKLPPACIYLSESTRSFIFKATLFIPLLAAGPQITGSSYQDSESPACLRRTNEWNVASLSFSLPPPPSHSYSYNNVKRKQTTSCLLPLYRKFSLSLSIYIYIHTHMPFRFSPNTSCQKYFQPSETVASSPKYHPKHP